VICILILSNMLEVITWIHSNLGMKVCFLRTTRPICRSTLKNSRQSVKDWRSSIARENFLLESRVEGGHTTDQRVARKIGTIIGAI
jgi:hypothetical protein